MTQQCRTYKPRQIHSSLFAGRSSSGKPLSACPLCVTPVAFSSQCGEHVLLAIVSLVRFLRIFPPEGHLIPNVIDMTCIDIFGIEHTVRSIGGQVGRGCHYVAFLDKFNVFKGVFQTRR